MSPQAYWLAIPLIGIALSGFGWLGLWLTRDRKHTGKHRGPSPLV
jgi:hypothetical protein